MAPRARANKIIKAAHGAFHATSRELAGHSHTGAGRGESDEGRAVRWNGTSEPI